MNDIPNAVCSKCGHQFNTSCPLGCPKCDPLPTSARIATLTQKIYMTRERAMRARIHAAGLQNDKARVVCLCLALEYIDEILREVGHE